MAGALAMLALLADRSHAAPSPEQLPGDGQVAAQQIGGPAAEGEPNEPAPELPEILGPAAPLDPAMVRRDEAGNATMRAVRISRPIELDGRLNDEVYTLIPAVGDFIQQLPREGLPATEATEVWVMFDDDNLYVAGRLYDSQPSRAVANELRRDHNNIFQGDNISRSYSTRSMTVGTASSFRRTN
jgi:hypothetical protein